MLMTPRVIAAQSRKADALFKLGFEGAGASLDGAVDLRLVLRCLRATGLSYRPTPPHVVRRSRTPPEGSAYR